MFATLGIHSLFPFGCLHSHTHTPISLLVPGDDLVAAVAKANPKTIVVVATVGMVLMPWAGDVAAILTNFMPGQEVCAMCGLFLWMRMCIYFCLDQCHNTCCV